MIEATTVSALARYLKDLLESNLTLTNLWVEGEISNLTRSQRGHVYFTLKDANAQIACVMFQRQYRGAPLESGAQVLAHGSVSFYEQRGNVQLIVDFVQPAGVGARQAEFERLKEKLAADGLFDEARKRPLPSFPARIGVVTSPTGAVFHDICNVLGRRWPLAEIVLAPSPVQGAEAAIGITEAIRQLNRLIDIDVIILARGGGSMEELWPFNDEALVRALARFPRPVCSGVGHETDVTLADLVADIRAPTPSAAAALVVPDSGAAQQRAERAWRRVTARVHERIEERRRRLETARRLVDRRAPPMRLAVWRQRLDEARRALDRAIARAVPSRRQRAVAAQRRLAALSPLAVLGRGYAIVEGSDGHIRASVDALATGDQVRLRMRDGRAGAAIGEIERA